MTYSVRLKQRAAKGLASLPTDIRRDLGARIEALSEDPFPHSAEPLRHELTGLHKLRAGGYRVVYEVDEARQVVTVVRVGHRHNVYK